MRIRKARFSDAQTISKMMRNTIRLVNSRDYSKLQVKAWLKSDRIKSVKESLNNPDRMIFVATENGKIAGVASMNLKDRELGSLYIRHNIHKKGIGTRLLKYIEGFAKENGVKKLRLGSTITALDFYKNHGYTAIKKDHCILLHGVEIPCILMSKRL